MIKMAANGDLDDDEPRLSDATLFALQEFLQEQMSQESCDSLKGGQNSEVIQVQEDWVGGLVGYTCIYNSFQQGY